jgi:hypothetical protein
VPQPCLRQQRARLVRRETLAQLGEAREHSRVAQVGLRELGQRGLGAVGEEEVGIEWGGHRSGQITSPQRRRDGESTEFSDDLQQ